MPDYPFANQDHSLIDLNAAIAAILGEYLPKVDISPEGEDDGRAVTPFPVRFDLPVDNQLPDSATVYAFLYKVHENLEVRSSLLSYAQPNGRLSARRVNVRFAYLLTYWAAKAGGENSGQADSDMMIINNSMLNALINNRSLPNLPGSITEVIPPEEGLNSLGNFWQALGDKPRLAFGYAVTLSVGLTEITAPVHLVRSTQLGMGNKPMGDLLLLAEQVLAAHLLAAMQAQSEITELERAQLSRLLFECVLLPPRPDAGSEAPRVEVKLAVSGALAADLCTKVADELATWKSQPKLGEIDGAALLVAEEVDIRQLRSIAPPTTRNSRS